MRVAIITILIITIVIQYGCQFPFYYKIKKIEGTIFLQDGKAVDVRFKSKRQLIIENCDNLDLDTFLRSLTLAKHGRRELEHLLTTSAKITIILSDKVGINFRDGKYNVIAGITGPSDAQSGKLVQNLVSKTLWSRLFNRGKYILVHEENTIEIFKGSVVYGNNTTMDLTKNNVKINDWHNNVEITNFSMDTIRIEPFNHPDLMYKNSRELYYFCGLHEIYHTRPENIELQQAGGNSEYYAMKLERKAFKKRKRINKIK